jgi:hypothetical protein
MPRKRTFPRDTAAQAPQDAEPGVQPAIYSIPDARRRVGGIGTTKAYELIAEGEWIAVKLGGRTFITAESLDAFISNLQRADIRMGQNHNNNNIRLKKSATLGDSGGVAPT